MDRTCGNGSIDFDVLGVDESKNGVIPILNANFFDFCNVHLASAQDFQSEISRELDFVIDPQLSSKVMLCP